MHRIRVWLKSVSWRDGIMLAVGALLAFGLVRTNTMVHNAIVTPVPYQSAGITAAWIPSTVKHWNDPINQMAQKYDIDANLVAIITTMESGGNPKAKSEANAMGLMQVTPATAQFIAAHLLKKPVKTYDLSNPTTNIEFGTAYLAYLRDQFGTAKQGPDWNSTVELIGAGYNGGPGAATHLEKGDGLQDIQTVSYSRDVFNMWRERHVADSPTFDRWRDRGGNLLIDAAQTAEAQ